MAARLAIVTTDIYAMSVLGRGQLEYFRDKGVDLTLICGGAADKFSALEARRVGRVVRVSLRRKPSLVADLAALFSLWRLFVRNRFDAVVCSTPKAMLLGSIAAACALQPNRTAFVRGRAYENYTGIKRGVYETFDRIAFACSHKVIFLSRSLREAYREDGLDPDRKGMVVRAGSSNGVDVERFEQPTKAERSALRDQLGMEPDEFHIVLAARIAPDKGIATGLELIDRLADRKDVHWWFVGGVEDDDLLAGLKARSTCNVRHVDHTDRLQDWLGAADLHFMPSRREGFGNVAAEAAATGLPTFAFDVVGLRDSVKHGVSGKLFALDDLDAIEQAIRAAANDGQEFRSRFPDARAWVQTTFPQKAIWDDFLATYLKAGQPEASIQ